MNFANPIRRLFGSAVPDYAFELSEAGVAYAATAKPEDAGFRAFTHPMLAVSSAQDNVLNPDAFLGFLGFLRPPDGKKRTAALVLPDHSARVQVVDFDTFPDDPEEQRSLVRFRLRKTVPFDLDAAALSLHVQPPSQRGAIDVVAALISHEIVARYEALFRLTGYQPGFVTVSGLAALNLIPDAAASIVAKLSGHVLTVLAVNQQRLKLVRILELGDVTAEDVLGVLYPTVAYFEDETGHKPERLILCGFDPRLPQWAEGWAAPLGVPAEALQSRWGAPSEWDAGLRGYLESAGAWQ